MQPLDPYWPAEDRADFLPFTIQTLSDAAGHVYGMWHETDCRVLFYRKDLVPVPPRRPGTSCSTTASRVAREQHIVGLSLQRRPVGGRPSSITSAMFWAQGGELVDDDGRPIFGEPPNRERCSASSASCATRSSAARRRDRCSATTTTSS